LCFGIEPGKGTPILNLSFFVFGAGTEALPALSCILMMLPNGTLTGGASLETANS